MVSTLYLYLNHYPSLCGLKSSQSTLESRCNLLSQPIPDCIPPIMYQDINYRQLHQHFSSLPIRIQRALRLLYDVSYQFHKGRNIDNMEPRGPTFIGNEVAFYETIYGKKAPLIMMNTFCNDWDLLRAVHTKKLNRTLTAAQSRLSFLIGEEIRKLYKDAHESWTH